MVGAAEDHSSDSRNGERFTATIERQRTRSGDGGLWNFAGLQLEPVVRAAGNKLQRDHDRVRSTDDFAN